MLTEFAADLNTAENWNRYTMNASLDPVALTVSGAQQVEVRNRADTPFDALYFHLYPNHPDFGGGLSVENVRVNGQAAPISTEQNNILLRVELSQPLIPGAWAIVTMDFTARTQRNASGNTYGAFNMQSGVWSLATFYPILAVYQPESAGGSYVGWDRRPVSGRGDLVVSEVALYDVTLDTPADWSLVTTGARVGEPAIIPQSSQRRERFVSGPQRDFFLAALQGLDQASNVVDGTRITTYYQPGDTAAGQRSLRVAEQSLQTFNQRYGRYPLAELDVIQAALTRFLGVEYPGVVLIEENLYRQNGRTLDTTVAHEVAHQWWYSLVGNDYQGEPWLDEGLASYSQVIFYEALGQGELVNAELENFRRIYLSTRQDGRDAAVDRPVTSFEGNYFALVYAKSALFFAALRDQIGDEAFFNFIQAYYANYRYREADGDGLRAIAERSCSCDLREFYADWITDAAAVELP
ncbi:MAG: M1 family metallopeptidase [Chloroflexales bacterium]|nr:M1 family metallopeptidase [Chloroflexales bacterium]